MGEFYPEIESNIGLPANAALAFPELSPAEELNMRARTIKLLAEYAGTPIVPSADHMDQANLVAKEMMADPKLRPDYAKYPNETMAYLAGMISQTNCMLVDELADLKLYVCNKLIYIVEHTDNDKDRLSALKSLGEIDGVDAFKKRSEMTVNIKPIVEVESELKNILESLDHRTLSESTAPLADARTPRLPFEDAESASVAA